MTDRNKKMSFGLIMAVYLLGIFMGAIDTGIVTPARTVIQNDLLVDDKIGVWIISIYTLAYAASIPVMGKLADRLGRKNIYLVSIFLFGFGSLLCGLAQSVGSFSFLLAARAIQAIGGGGILPVATAEFGSTFPPEKRGMALGLVGGVFGMANIFGASAGSAILDIFGTSNWQFIFYVNLPITLFILIAGFIVLPNTKEESVKKIDFVGITILTVMVLSLLYGLKNVDFFNFLGTLQTTAVYPFLLTFIVLLPIFVWVEKRAEDPVLNLSYFKNSQIIITLILAFITGVVMMGMIFVPQFSENAMKMRTGSGGYYVIILGLCAGIGAPLSGKLIDKYGVKIVLGFGLFASIAGALFLILVAANHPNLITIVVSLMIIGVGVGFTMGTPLNYMMLDNTDPKESTSALATVSLIRSIGTAIAPAIMIGFLAHAGIGVQGNIMELLPNEAAIPPLPYAQELTLEINTLKTDEKTKDQFANMDIPDLATLDQVEINMNNNSDFKVPKDLQDMMQTSDVTNIVANTKTFASAMFAQMTPDVILDIENGLDSGIEGINAAIVDMDGNLPDMEDAYKGIGKGINGMSTGLGAQQKALGQLEKVSVMMAKMGDKTNADSVVDLMPPDVKNKIPSDVLADLATVKTASDLNAKIAGLQGGIDALNDKINEAKNSKAGIEQSIQGMESSLSVKKDLINQYNIAAAALGGGEGSNLLEMLPEDVKAGLSSEVLSALSGMTAVSQIGDKTAQIQGEIDQINGEIEPTKAKISQEDTAISQMSPGLTAQNTAMAQLKSVAAMMSKYTNYNSIVDLMPADVKASMPKDVLADLAKVKTADDLNKKINELKSSIKTLNGKIKSAKAGKTELAQGMASIKNAEGTMSGTIYEMTSLKQAIPGAFKDAEKDYLKKIDGKKVAIENEFQATLNGGFQQVYATVVIASALGMILLLLYKEKRKKPQDEIAPQ
ncbi:MAG: MFS transporter [Clostridiales bacterium]